MSDRLNPADITDITQLREQFPRVINLACDYCGRIFARKRSQLERQLRRHPGRLGGQSCSRACYLANQNLMKGQAKLTPAQRREAAAALANRTATQKELAARYGIHPSTISRINKKGLA